MIIVYKTSKTVLWSTCNLKCLNKRTICLQILIKFTIYITLKGCFESKCAQ